MIDFEFFSQSLSKPFTRKIILLSNVTSYGSGDYCNFYTLLSQFTGVIQIGGTQPTSVTVALEGSIDGVVWVHLEDVVVTGDADPYMFHIVNKPVPMVRGNYVSKVGGDSSTSVTLEIVAGGN